MSKTVLMVDDSKMALDMLGFTLDAQGYQTVRAASGPEALEVLVRREVDLVLVDVNMPGMDGYSLTRKIREDDRLAAVPVVMVTTRTQPADRQKGFDAGANAYLTKPVDGEELIAQVQLLIGDAGD